EVLKNGQTFTEVRDDGRLDDFTRRFSHQTAHSCQLPHLLSRTTSARIRHDEDRIEARFFRAITRLRIDHDFATDTVHHRLGYLVGNTSPDIYDLVVALARSDETFLILLKNALNLSLGRIDQDLLAVRDHHVVHAYAN